MDLSLFFCICVTNNYELAKSVKNVKYIERPAISILMEARDLIHLGWRLVASPLYGNFKPDQQPYRTLILKRCSTAKGIDASSLSMIESAIRVYSETKTMPGSVNFKDDGDFRFIDFALMEEALEKCGLLSEPIKRIIRK